MKISRISVYLILILIISTFFLKSTIIAEDIDINQPYILESSGDIVYDYQHGKMLATGEVVFETAGLRVEAEEVIVDITQTIIEARGEIKISIEGQLITGQYLKYDYKDLTGSIYGAQSKLDSIYFKGKELKLIQDADYELELLDTSFTDCLLAEPHYQISARQIRVYPQNKIIAKEVGFYLGNTRLFTLPTYVVEYLPEEGVFKNLMPVPKLGYNSAEGLSVELYIPYELNPKTEGSINAQYAQKGERNIELEHRYQLNNELFLVGSYNNQVEKDDEGNYNQEETLSGGVIYQKKPFLINSFLNYDLLKKEYSSSNSFLYNKEKLKVLTAINYNFNTGTREEKLDIEYSPFKKTSLALYQEYNNEILNKESYKISQAAKINWDMSYRKGYEVDYLPYLTASFPEFKIFNTGFKTGLGLGKQENEGISTDKIGFNISADKKIVITPALNLNLKGEVVDNYYYPDKTSYQSYQLGISSHLMKDINERVKLQGSLGYLLTRDRGDPLLPADKVDNKETIEPSVKFIYRLPEPETYWEFGLSSEYSLPDNEWESVITKVVKHFDCYSYSVYYDFVDNSFGLNIDF